MKSKVFLVSFIAFLAIAFALQTVSAATVGDVVVKVDDIVASATGTTVVSGEVSNTVPVKVFFTALEDMDDVTVKVYIEGYRDEISEQTARFHVVDGVDYVKRFSLKLPSSMELDDLTEDLFLRVRITAKGQSDPFDEGYAVLLQKEQFSLSFLSVDLTQEVVSGDTIALDVVLENNGHEELENVYIKASIPELGIERKIYAGDVDEQDERDFEDDRDLNRRDTVNKRLYLTVPRNAMPGVYEVVLEAYNFDTTVSTKDRVVVNSIETGVLPSVTARAVELGEETTFEVVLINPNDRMVVYTITPEESKGLIVEIMDPIVTVPSDSSKTVRVRVKATESAEEGTHLVTVNVNSETELVRQVNFTVNVEEDAKTSSSTTTVVGRSNAVVILTVVLVIVFVVLLIILIVLLTKRPSEPEEFGETSYY